jgi:hypothetical protein
MAGRCSAKDAALLRTLPGPVVNSETKGWPNYAEIRLDCDVG